MELRACRSSPFQLQLGRPPTLTVITFFFLVSLTTSSALFDNLSFSFSSFDPRDIEIEGDATLAKSYISLSASQVTQALSGSSGWATYVKPMHLWDKTTGHTADFSTRFSFIMQSLNSSETALFGDGLTFFLAPNGSHMPLNNSGAYLALCNLNHSLGGVGVSPPDDISRCNTSFNFIAVEFDTYTNPDWDPQAPTSIHHLNPHVGIDINTIKSAFTKSWQWNKILTGGQVGVWIDYNSSVRNLSVRLLDETSDSRGNSSNVNYTVNLSDFLPEWVTFGFSGATGQLIEVNKILSWDFSSSLLVADPDESNRTTSVEPNTAPSSLGLPAPPPAKKTNKTWVWVVVSCTGAFALLIVFSAISWLRRSKHMAQDPTNSTEEDGIDKLMIEGEFEKLPGFGKFSYSELATATDEYAEGHLLGQGGSGKVYEGYLSRLGSKVAIKKIIPNPDRGLKEYVAEVKVVSQLRHRNLVQLMGLCHETKELIIVYEFMSNGSLDQHLFKGKTMLTLRSLGIWPPHCCISMKIGPNVSYIET